MQLTMKLIDAALSKDTASSWAAKLGLHRNAITACKQRGSVSPTIAFCIAENLGQDAKAWALLAAAENERDSKCKERMLKALGGNGGIRTLDEALHPILP
jgi:plasmid maintenance system antidote protein VapI